MAIRRSGAKIVHAHGCTRCLTRYEDSCETPSVNALCSMCTYGHDWQLLVENRKPKDCCRVFSKLCTADEKKQYALAGDVPWWKCKECGRTQIYEPRTRTP